MEYPNIEGDAYGSNDLNDGIIPAGPFHQHFDGPSDSYRPFHHESNNNGESISENIKASIPLLEPAKKEKTTGRYAQELKKQNLFSTSSEFWNWKNRLNWSWICVHFHRYTSTSKFCFDSIFSSHSC